MYALLRASSHGAREETLLGCIWLLPQSGYSVTQNHARVTSLFTRQLLRRATIAMQPNAPASHSRLLDALDDSFVRNTLSLFESIHLTALKSPTQPSNGPASNERVRALREALAKQAATSSSQPSEFCGF